MIFFTHQYAIIRNDDVLSMWFSKCSNINQEKHIAEVINFNEMVPWNCENLIHMQLLCYPVFILSQGQIFEIPHTVEPQFTRPLFTMFPNLPDLLPFSYSRGITLELSQIYPHLPCIPIYCASRFTMLFSFTPWSPVNRGSTVPIAILLYYVWFLCN